MSKVYLIKRQFLPIIHDVKLLLQLVKDENVKAYTEEMQLYFA